MDPLLLIMSQSRLKIQSCISSCTQSSLLLYLQRTAAPMSLEEAFYPKSYMASGAGENLRYGLGE